MSRASSSPGAADVVVTSLTKSFRGHGRDDRVVALDDLSLTIEPSSVVALVGSNGAGKSTLLSVIAGSTLADEGEVRVGGREVTGLASWRRASLVARVRQNPELNVFGALTIQENFALRIAGIERSFSLRRATGARVRETAKAALAPFGMGIEDRLDSLAQTLSGGQRQAVAVAMAMLGESSVLLLDEHTAALDPKSARLVSERTRAAIRERRITTLMVTHDMHQALDEADRLIMLHRGRIVLDVQGTELSNMDVPALVARFEDLAGEAMSDRTLLA